ncbi:MAG: L-2-hydroxyglutarate oxidase [Armatimonadetes bacterium]|nr:L-2-hydroxyglutarate oxidase [Armatimonadota bacterium]
MTAPAFDIAVIGGGIVGLASARALLQRRPQLRLVLLEKERTLGAHQTGHNSGVLHSGIYYRPGSLRARLCVEGRDEMVAFCKSNGIRHEECGKLILATREEELPRLDALYERGVANGLTGIRRLGPPEIADVEPHARGLAAVHTPTTGIVDYGGVVRALAREIADLGGEIRTNGRVWDIRRGGATTTIETEQGPITVRAFVNCAGLYSDLVARMAGAEPDVQIIPFRGEYYLLRPSARRLVRGLIYPVPDPSLPFLGVHLTRMVGGDVEAGPNAVFAFAREGYSVWNVQAAEIIGSLRYRGLWRLAARWWRTAAYEYYRSFSKAEFVRSLQRLVPDLRPEDVFRHGAGVRAQAVTRTGELFDDFYVLPQDGAIHLLNAPSPAATASLAIGRHVAELSADAFSL